MKTTDVTRQADWSGSSRDIASHNFTPAHLLKRTEQTLNAAYLARCRSDGLRLTLPQLLYLCAAWASPGGHQAAIARLVGLPAPSARAQSLFSVRGHPGEESESITVRARNASNEMMAVEGVLLQCVDGPQVKQIVFNVAVMDYAHLRTMGDQQLLWLKRGLNALASRRQLKTQGKSDNGVGKLYAG